MKEIKCARFVALRNLFHARFAGFLGERGLSLAIRCLYSLTRRSEHSDNTNVTAQKNCSKGIGCVTFFPRKKSGTETNSELRNIDAEFLGRKHVTAFVQGNRDQQPHDDNDYTDNSHVRPLSSSNTGDGIPAARPI